MFRLRIDGLLTVRVGRGETRAAVRVRDPASFRGWLAGALGPRGPVALATGSVPGR